MTANPHPINAPYDARDASALKAYGKLHERVVVADAAEVRNTDFSAQYGGLYIKDLSANFNLSTSITSADDGVDVIIDGAGTHFVRVVDATAITQRTVTSAGDLTIAADDVDQINLKKAVAAATRAILPLSSARTKPVRIVDRKYDANTNNITVVPKRPNVVTMTLASPCVIALAAHGKAVNDPVSLETTGALYTGLLPDTQYYVKTVPDSGHFTVSLTPGGAAINTSGSQSGVHTAGFDTIMGGASYTIDSNGASLQLTPLADQTGWS